MSRGYDDDFLPTIMSIKLHISTIDLTWGGGLKFALTYPAKITSVRGGSIC